MHEGEWIRAAVTGASGFIGRRLMAALGPEAVAVPREDLSALAGADVVFHLAALTVVGDAEDDVLAARQGNVTLTERVLTAARESAVRRVVVSSTDMVHGPDAPVPTPEDAPLRPEGAYAGTKAAAEHMALGWPTPPEAIVVRLSNVYGPGDPHTSRLVPGVVADVVAGRAPTIRGDGRAGRDLLYVDDAVAALLAAARDGVPGEAYNAGTGISTTVREVVDLAVELAGGGAPPEVLGQAPPAEGGRRAVDATKLRDQTGWAPQVDLREGLTRTIAAERAASAA